MTFQEAMARILEREFAVRIIEGRIYWVPKEHCVHDAKGNACIQVLCTNVYGEPCIRLYTPQNALFKTKYWNIAHLSQTR